MSVRPAVLISALSLLAACNRSSEPPVEPPGHDRTATTRALETGATAMQSNAPIGQINIHLVGFHPLKDDPSQQMEAHHYCNQVNEDFTQCVLFDGNTRDANLHGVEFIVSEKLYAALPEGERQYWHPHNYEILSGQLVAPGIPDAAEKELMRRKMNSYGKTWHVWSSKVAGRPPDKLPLGPAHLAWSFTVDGQLTPGLLQQRDRTLGIDSGEKRRQREDLKGLARP